MLIAAIIFFAGFTQSIAGFGFALIASPLLIEAIGIQAGPPLVSIVSITAEVILLFRFRHSINRHALGRLALASLTGIPLGVLFLRSADEGLMMALLGMVIIAYALYGLLNLRLPEIQHPRWAYGFGFASGLLSGAYNVGGPPVVIYGTCRRWTPQEFKSNLQGFFLINSIAIIIVRTLAHDYTPDVLQNYLIALPGLAFGLVAGLYFDRLINPVIFRKLVLVLLIFLGLRLLF